jgi:hypothetical protein
MPGRLLYFAFIVGLIMAINFAGAVVGYMAEIIAEAVLLGLLLPLVFRLGGTARVEQRPAKWMVWKNLPADHPVEVKADPAPVRRRGF